MFVVVVAFVFVFDFDPSEEHPPCPAKTPTLDDAPSRIYPDSVATLTWNGIDLPDELRKLPPSRYVITTDETPGLAPEQELGLARALSSLDQGQGLAHSKVLDRIDKLVRR